MGELPGGYTDEPVQTVIDSADALLVGRAMVKLTLSQRRLVGLHYVDGKSNGYIAAFLKFPTREFDHRMRRVQAELEAILAKTHQNSDSQ
jgi:DNA-directed RNA polymerase specialized sigma24 family protein